VSFGRVAAWHNSARAGNLCLAVADAETPTNVAISDGSAHVVCLG
jgi:hypothetical protein